MTFQQYIKFMMGYMVSKESASSEKKGHSRNKQNNMYHHWFGLLPLSIKLWLSNHQSY